MGWDLGRSPEIFFTWKWCIFVCYAYNFLGHVPAWIKYNYISNVLESSIALAAVAGRLLGRFIVQSIDIWFNHCNRTNGEAVNKETRHIRDFRPVATRRTLSPACTPRLLSSWWVPKVTPSKILDLPLCYGPFPGWQKKDNRNNFWIIYTPEGGEGVRVSKVSHLTRNRSFRGWLLQTTQPNQQRQRLKAPKDKKGEDRRVLSVLSTVGPTVRLCHYVSLLFC